MTEMHPTIAKILRPFFRSEATLRTNVSGEAPVLAAGEPVSVDGADRLTRAMHRGDRLLALGGKWSYTPFMMTASDMQFLESRKFTVDEICRFFSVHPSFVFADSTSNYKSSEMATSSFLRDTLNPILRQIESEMTRKLFPGSVGERVRFNREEIYATDLEGRMKYVEKRIQTGTMSPNEARASLGMPRVEGGDAVLMSANLKTIDQLRQDNGEKI